MAKTETIILNGIVKWVRYKTLDKFGKYSCTLYPDAPSLTKFKKLKEEKQVKNELKKDDDGFFIRLSSVPEKVMRGVKVRFAIDALDALGKPMDEEIGNGSTAAVKIDVYPYNYGGKDGHAIRWKAIKVTNLVPYQGRDDWTPEETKVREGMEAVGEPEW